MEPKIENILSLIEQSYEFLNAGLFLNEYIKRNNLSIEAKNIDIKFSNNERYFLKGNLIKSVLSGAYIDSNSGAYIDSNKRNIIGYFVEWNAFRGIFMAICEGKKNNEFKKYLKDKLGSNKYFHFDAIIRFCRNVLSHNIEDEIKLSKEDFRGTKGYIDDNPCKFENGIVNFEFNYLRDFWEKIPQNLPKDYGFKINIDFSKMEEGKRFIIKDGKGIISGYNLFMLSELCYNFAFCYNTLLKKNKKKC